MPAMSPDEITTLFDTKLAKDVRKRLSHMSLADQLTMLLDDDPPPGRGARIRLYGHPLDKSTSHE